MKPHLSNSQLEMLAKCPTQYEWRYVRGVKKPPGFAQVVGTGTHEAAAANLWNKLEFDELLPEDDVKAKAADAVHRRFADEAPVCDADENEGVAVDEAVSLATLHHRELAPTLEPTAVEEAHRIVLDGFPYDLELVIDVEETERIRDLKTASKRPSEGLTTQGAIYTLDAKLRGEPKPFVRDVLLKQKRPSLYTTPEEYATKDDHQALLLRVEAAARVIEAGAFAPTSPDNYWCSSRFCGFYDNDCPWGARKRTGYREPLIDVSRLTSQTSSLRHG